VSEIDLDAVVAGLALFSLVVSTFIVLCWPTKSK
jgi:hypothetical protein